MKAILFSTGLGLVVLLAGCGKPEEKPPVKATSADGNPLTAPVDYLGALGQAKQRAEKVADTAQINQAIMFFNEAEGRYPADLSELVAKGYLRETPKPPYGMKIIYDATKGEVRVVKQ